MNNKENRVNCKLSSNNPLGSYMQDFTVVVSNI